MQIEISNKNNLTRQFHNIKAIVFHTEDSDIKLSNPSDIAAFNQQVKSLTVYYNDSKVRIGQSPFINSIRLTDIYTNHS